MSKALDSSTGNWFHGCSSSEEKKEENSSIESSSVCNNSKYDTSDHDEDTPAGAVKDSLLLEHFFQPGDHVIRWEMLPIAWPIQIHGIVLETTENSVTLSDFGLTAKPVNEDDLSSTDQQLQDTPVQPFIDHPVSQKVEQAVVAAWEKFKPKQEIRQRRQRITVQTITDPKELSRWKKVNYGGNVCV